MSFLFPKKKKAVPPPVPEPAPLPEIDERVGDEARRRVKKQAGFRKTILTGGLQPQTGKKKRLG